MNLRLQSNNRWTREQLRNCADMSASVHDHIGFARKKLGSVVAPKEIAFCGDIPKNKSSKIMRRLLKARDLGLPEGDTSTLEVG